MYQMEDYTSLNDAVRESWAGLCQPFRFRLAGIDFDGWVEDRGQLCFYSVNMGGKTVTGFSGYDCLTDAIEDDARRLAEIDNPLPCRNCGDRITYGGEPCPDCKAETR